MPNAANGQLRLCMCRAAIAARSKVAIPDAELRATGLLKDDAPEAARLFWGGKELVNVGDDRWYPKRCAACSSAALCAACNEALTQVSVWQQTALFRWQDKKFAIELDANLKYQLCIFSHMEGPECTVIDNEG
jgi:hypothetical protein